MNGFDALLARQIARRRLLAAGAAAGGALALGNGLAGPVSLPFSSGPRQRPVSDVFPEKGAMIVQRVRPPLLETPMAVFDQGVFTPNDRFFVRWHWSDIPLSVDPASFRLTVTGAVERPLNLSLDELLGLPRVALAAVNQCAGNSRGTFEPRVPGAQWGHGAMGNARWEGVALKTLLGRAGLRPGAVAVRFAGLDRPLTDADPYAKSLPVEVARDSDAMVAFAMNGEQLPLLNGFPLRLVMPGWFSTYWIKALSRIEVLDSADTNFWMAKAYKAPTTPGYNVPPGTKDFDAAPISTMVPRSFITNLADGARAPATAPLLLSGIAFGGAHGVKAVEISDDGGNSWKPARLGSDEGRYSFRRFTLELPPASPGAQTLMTRCTASDGTVQPTKPNWNPGGYARGCIEAITVVRS